MFRTAGTILTLALLGTLIIGATPPEPAERDLEARFTATVRPFLDTYCIACHGGNNPAAQFDMRTYSSFDAVVQDSGRWALILEKLAANQMPPQGIRQPSDEARQNVVAWVEAFLGHEAKKHAGDPGIVLARRLSNAEFNYTIRDLTGVDIRPAREFPVDPANPAGFDNSGESLAMSPALLTKYLQAAREVASHLVLEPTGFGFAPNPMLVETDRDKYCVGRIIDFYNHHNTDYAAYFQAAWRFKHRAGLGKPKATLADVAADNNVSPKYLATIWRALEVTNEDVGPIARLQAMWRELPQTGNVEAGAADMRDFVVALRRKIELQHPDLAIKGIRRDSQPFLMWRNKQYATHRTSYDRQALQVEGETTVTPPDPDLQVPAGARARYEAAFARFAAVFPDAFYISERGRYFPDNTRDKGRHLSAGFHNLMGYFRDDLPLYEMILDAKQQKELDALWRELDFVASANIRTYIQFFLNESGEGRGLKRETEGPRPADKEITSEAAIKEVADAYLARARASGNETAIKAIEEHFAWTNAGIRWVEQARIAAEPTHLAALQEFAARAYRRPLSQAERAELLAFYKSRRGEAKLDHEEAMRDSIVSILMSPDFSYRIDLTESGDGIRPLSDYALASRLSYFLWSSMPDGELIAQAAAGNLRRPEVLVKQALRMLKDPRARGLATEFGANWLDFRRFEELNTVDRERFSTFDNDLRRAMFEEPVRFMLDVFRQNRSVLDFVYANHTFVNPSLAKHYGMPDISGDAETWVRVDDANRYGRGGLLPMAAFLTKNAPGLRTSPVKRGYWVVKQVLGERIPPPPAVVPELPRDEAKIELPLRDMLARHRSDKTCASCHARFDSMGLVFEGYGPIGERRTQDLGGRPVDDSATFPGGMSGAGVEGLRTYVRAHRQNDFVNNLSRKLLAFALGRSLMLSDEILIEEMRTKLAANEYRFNTLVESIVTSSQFRNKRGGDLTSLSASLPRRSPSTELRAKAGTR
jgi:mono/diheme cytochrome c family protein